jgi:flagellar assembly protein FliH
VPRHEYDPIEAEREATEILERANDEAAILLHKAVESSKQIMEDAFAEAEVLKAEARQQGALDGFADAKSEVEADLSVAWNKRVDDLQSDIQVLIDAIAVQRTTLWEQTEQEVLAFVMEMAKRVVKVEIQQNPEVVGEMIRHGLRRVADKENMRIRVSPDELEAVRADRNDLLLILDGARQLEIIEDRRVGRGGCVIETSAGTIDARIDTQFEQIADKLGVIPLGGEADE